MLIAPINIILFCFGIYSILSKKINFYLFTIIFFATSFFGFLPGFTDYGIRSINNYDLAIVLLLLGIIFLPKKNNFIEKHRLYSTYKKLTLGFIIYVIGLILYDVFISGNSFANVLIESRAYLFLLSLKLIDRIDLNNTSKLINILVYIISIKSFIYATQYVLNVEIFESSELLLSQGKFSGFYSLSPLIIIYLLNKPKKIFVDILSIFFLVLSSILLGSSGYILANASILICFIYFAKKSIIKMVLGFLIIPLTVLLIALFPSNISNEENISADFSLDFKEALNFTSEFNSSRDITEFYHGGSFQFRLAMFAERALYLIDNDRLLFGDGFTPDSKLDYQIFILGTHTDYYRFGIEQYNSADFLYVNLISRFGLIGTILFIYLFIYLFKFSKYNMFFFSSFIIFILLTSLNSNILYKMSNLILIYLIVFTEVQLRFNNHYTKTLS